jgi:hypothetical protein
MRLRLLLLLALLTAGQHRAGGAEPRMSWLDNGIVRLGVDLSVGGAITWLSRAGDDRNTINSFDWGRQVQMSYYSGPVPYIFGNKRPKKFWEGLGWNPIQAGDDFGHGSKVLEHRNDGRQIYVKCIPMQWPLDNVPGDCVFESWLELDGQAVRARCRLTNQRADKTFYPARDQELPAVYTNGWLHRIVSYTGGSPFTDAAVATIAPKGPEEGWTRWRATEGWSALLDDTGWGVGVWSPETVSHLGGFSGKPGPSGPRDGSCGYIAPTRREILDHDIVHEYTYDLILGNVEEIRAHARQRRSDKLPAWRFQTSRQGWYYEGLRDQGWPIGGELAVTTQRPDSWLVSPDFALAADAAPTLVIDAAFPAGQENAQLFWQRLEDSDFAGERSLLFSVTGDGAFREYRISLRNAQGYSGLIRKLRLDVADAEGVTVRIRSIRFGEE